MRYLLQPGEDGENFVRGSEPLGDPLFSFLVQQYAQKCVPHRARVHEHLLPNPVLTTPEGNWGPGLERVRMPGLQA